MHVIKSTGEKVEFDKDKIRGTLRRTGADEQLVERVLERVVKQVHNGMKTRKLFTVIRRELRKEKKFLAQRYGLRTALAKLGPAGFKFEKYVSSILNAYQYKAYVPDKEFTGLCVNHELDVIATRNSHRIVIEAKFRNKFGDTVRLKDVMATWARYLDLCDGHKASKTCPRFDEMWIVTNGKYTDRALQFGLCKGVNLVGWGNGDSLAKLVDHATLYPVTVLDGLKQWELDRFSDRDIMLCQEVVAVDVKKLSGMVGLNRARTQKIWSECQAVIEGR